MKKKIITLASLLAISSIAAAKDKPDNCNTTNISQAIFECSQFRLSESDKKLNENYKSINDQITRTYKENPKLGEDLKSKTKRSQLTWLKLREENCAIESFIIETGTQAFETTKNNCIARENEERSSYLFKLKNSIL